MTTPEPVPPADDSKVASIAWAVAVIVVALVIGLIAWLALGPQSGDRASGPQTPPAPTALATETSAPESSAPPATGSAGESGAQGGDAAARTAPPEVVEMMLGLQRRDADDPTAVGDVDAPVVLIEYADYRCPFCAKFALQTRPGLQGLVDDGTLRIEFRDFVIFDEQSHAAAVAARAAAEQDRFEDYQAALFALSTEGHAELERQDLLDLAEQVGVPDLARFEADLDDPELAAAVDADTAEARSLGLTSTPTFLVNTAVVQGAQPLEHFEQVIASELEAAQQQG